MGRKRFGESSIIDMFNCRCGGTVKGVLFEGCWDKDINMGTNSKGGS